VINELEKFFKIVKKCFFKALASTFLEAIEHSYEGLLVKIGVSIEG
jgi:hypothetical protein